MPKTERPTSYSTSHWIYSHNQNNVLLWNALF